MTDTTPIECCDCCDYLPSDEAYRDQMHEDLIICRECVEDHEHACKRIGEMQRKLTRERINGRPCFE